MTTTASPPSDTFLAVRTRLEPRTVTATVAVTFSIVVAASAVAWDGTAPPWEAETLRWIVGWPDWFEPVLWLVQQAGVLFAPVVAGLVVVSLTRQGRHIVPFVLILPLKLTVEKAIVKQLVDRERPYTSVGPDIDVRGPQLAGMSFPSGHATTAVAVAVVLVAFLPPKWRPVPLAWAFGVALARLYFGEHNVLDVVVGAALGTAFAIVLWFVFLNREVAEGAAG